MAKPKSKAKKPAYQFTGCTTIGCPRYADSALPVEMHKDSLWRDTAGNHWCTACSKRYELMNWAHEHRWPEARVKSLVHAGHYAITDDYADWFSSIAMGNQDMIDALYAALIEQPKSA